jgi:predicted ferric reductase
MRKSLAIFAIFVTVVAAAWFLSDSLYLVPYDQQKFGVPFTQLSGVLAIALMAFSTLISIRPIWLEPYFNGLDKMYRLHKWIGIVALVIAVVHWLTAQGARGGQRPQTVGAATALPDASGAAAQSLFGSLEGPAIGLAQPALWLLLALVAIALIKVIPYHIFALTHRLVPAVFLVLVFHSAVLMKAAYWTQPVGLLMAAIYLAGTVAALIALFRLIGARRKTEATVTAKTYFPDVQALLVEMQMDPGWKGHEPGQFAFVGSRKRWGAHPFTIASQWRADDSKISFIVKELGDETRDLEKKLQVGTRLVVEGPYGHFNFSDNRPRQIWVSGGIGITPFVARMKYLAQAPGQIPVDLFHSDARRSEDAYALMKADAAKSRVNLHLFVTPEQGRVTGATIRAAVPDWKSASVWFCGPTAFAAALKLDLMRNGLASQDFHHELFDMR